LIVDGQLPVSWVKSTISDVCSVNPTVDKSKYADNLLVSFVPMPAVEAETGRIDVSEAKKFQSVKKGYTPFQKDDVLFAKITPCMENGKMAVVPEVINNIAFGSTEFQVLRAFTGVLPNFIYYFVSSKMFRQDAEHNMSGAVGQRRVPKPYLEQSDIPIPPTKEQHRIVAKIEELFSEIDKGVESLKTAKAQLQVYRQALLKHAFEGKLTAQWRSNNPDKVLPAAELLRSIEQSREERYQQQLIDWQTAVEKWEFNGKEGKKPSKPNKLHLPIPIIVDDENLVKETPPEWLWLKYGSICEVVRNGISKKPEGDIGTKIFRISAVRPMLFEMNDYRFINNEDGEFDRYYLNYGDLVFTRYNGSVRYVGVCAEYRSNEPRLFPDKLIQTRLIANSIKSSYIEKAANCGKSRKYLESKIRTTAGQSGVSGEDIKGIPVPICSELEQNEILNIIEEQLSIATQNEEIIDLILKKAEMLRQSILKKAFSGQLVPQDPNDEPASKLLKRIQAEKAQRETTTKTKRKSTNLPRQLTVLRDI
jgi:type I restriction enzyme, S subunit